MLLIATILFGVLQSAAFAQITITASDLLNLFGAGTTDFTYSNRDSVETMNVGTPSVSAAQSWTAPAFVVLDSSILDNVSPSSTPYASDFPGATYAETFSETDTGVTLSYYAYLELSNDSLYFIGTAEHLSGSSGGHAIDSTVSQHGMKFAFHVPLSLGDVAVGAPDTTVFGPGIMQIVTTTSTYDAYGSLTLPNGTFQALRSYQVTTFKIYSGGSLVNSSTSYSLTWTTQEGHQLTVGVDSGTTSGTIHLQSISWTRVGQTQTAVKKSTEQPVGFALDQNYPNPFNPTTKINYQVATLSHVSLKIYNALGQEVATLVNDTKGPGEYSVNFDASRFSSGLYFYRLVSGSNVAAKKMLLIK